MAVSVPLAAEQPVNGFVGADARTPYASAPSASGCVLILRWPRQSTGNSSGSVGVLTMSVGGVRHAFRSRLSALPLASSSLDIVILRQEGTAPVADLTDAQTHTGLLREIARVLKPNGSLHACFSNPWRRRYDALLTAAGFADIRFFAPQPDCAAPVDYVPLDAPSTSFALRLRRLRPDAITARRDRDPIDVERLITACGAALGAAVEDPQVHIRTNSTTLRFRCRIAGRTQTLYCKTRRFDPTNRSLRVQQIRTEYDMLTLLHGAMDPAVDGTVVRPVALLPAEVSLISEEAPGEPLAGRFTALRHPVRHPLLQSLANLTHQCGAWLRRLQALTQQPGNYSALDLAGYCEKRVRLLAGAMGTPRTPWLSAVTKYVERMVPAVAAERWPLVGVHNDFTPFNILAHGERVIVLDLGGFSHGGPWRDFSKLWHHLQCLRAHPLVSNRAIERVQAALRAGFAAPVPQASAYWNFLEVAYRLDRMTECLEQTGGNWLRRRFATRHWNDCRKRIDEITRRS